LRWKKQQKQHDCMDMNPYLSPSVVRAALQRLNIQPTRGMGQNFLVNAHALQNIVDAAELAPDDVVLEVGPGLGVLTWELLQHTAHVVAVELDKRLAARLREEFDASAGQRATLHVLQDDILLLPPLRILTQAGIVQDEMPHHAPPYKVVANLPYAITSPVLRHFLEHPPAPQMMVVLVQWEVAQRITAPAGKLSMLAHAINMYAEPEIVGQVQASHFMPRPAVDSAILRLWKRPSPAVAVDDIDAFFRVIKAGFLQPRKKLSNALPGGLAALGYHVSREAAVQAMEEARVSPHRRAETLTLAEWAAVYTALHNA
jgi:16S rRNA (adenine1518-N6/adenine1519-N6)-dimethyltransferase